MPLNLWAAHEAEGKELYNRHSFSYKWQIFFSFVWIVNVVSYIPPKTPSVEENHIVYP